MSRSAHRQTMKDCSSLHSLLTFRFARVAHLSDCPPATSHWALAIILILLLVSGCSSLDLPPIAESEQVIAREGLRIAAVDSAITARNLRLPAGQDLIVRLRRDMINRILQALTGNATTDLTLTFRKSPNVVREDKSVLFVSYTNHIDIDGGSIAVDLKALRFDRMGGNRLDATLELEGRGSIAVSGRYLGVPASVTPDVYAYLNEAVSFQLSTDVNGNIVATPNPRTLTLRTRSSITLLAWSVPWNQDIPLQVTELLQPVTIPSSIISELSLPIPARQAGDQKYEFVPFEVRCSRTSVTANDDILEIRTNAELQKK